MKRIPKTLKKKLQASLEKLTPREAGRLALIYLHEAGDEDGLQATTPPAITELVEAWEARIEAARKRGAEEANREIALHNGYLFLAYLPLIANDWAERESYRVAYLASVPSAFIDRQLMLDFFGEFARQVADQIDHDLPYPVSREDYARLLSKVDRFNFEIDQNVVNEVMKAWSKSQGAELVTDEDLADAPGLEDEDGQPLTGADLPTDEERQAADAKAAAFNQKRGEVIAQIEDLIASGRLPVAQAADLNDLYDSTLIEDGLIPAWAALRSIFKGWVIDHDVLIDLNPKIERWAIRGAFRLYTIDGDLEGEDLANVVAEFVADCRARPWGDGLATTVDLDRLARFLIAKETPLTEDEGEALQLGRVNFQTFVDADGKDGLLTDKVFRVATCRDLHAVGEALGLVAKVVAPEAYLTDKGGWSTFGKGPRIPAFDESRLVTDYYYPTRDPEARREELAGLMNMIKALEFSRRPMDTAGREARDYLGEGFASQIEYWIKTMGQAYGEIATIKRVFDIIGEEYFDGLPVLLPYNSKAFADHGLILQDAEESLQDWLTRLEGDPWNVDMTALQLVKGEADEAKAREKADLIIQLTVRMNGLDEPRVQIDLGDGLDPRARPKAPPKPEAKKTKKAKAAPVEAAVEVEGEEE